MDLTRHPRARNNARVLQTGLDFHRLCEAKGRQTGQLPITDVPLLERFRELEKLKRKDREMVISFIDAWVGSRHVEEVVTRRMRRSA